MINKTGRIGKMFSSYGLAQIPLLIGLLIMAIAVPVATKLVEENQDTRNLATSCVAGIVNTYGCGGTVSVSVGAYGCTNSVNTKCPADKWAQLSRTSTCSCSAVCATSTACSTANPPPATSTPKPAATSTPIPTKTCSSIYNATECGYTPGCYWYNNKCNGTAPTIGIVTLTPKPTSTPVPVIVCSSITNATECGYTPNCYWYNNKCSGVKPTVGLVTLTPKPTSLPDCSSLTSYNTCILNNSCYWDVVNKKCYVSPSIVCKTITNATECGYTPGCYWYSNKCSNVKPTIGLVTLTPKPTVTCSTVNDPTECGYVPGCYWYDNKCTNVKPTIVLVTLTPKPSGVVTGGPIVTEPPIVITKPPVTGTVCKESLTGNLLQCCHPEDSDGTSKDSLCDWAGKVATCGGSDYCCPTLNGNWTTDMTKCNLKCTTCANGKNRAIGDADCNGVVDVNDRSIWTTEFVSDGGNRTEKDSWLSDFDCNGVVDVNDRTIWSTNFTI